jgi:hypothetical protein
MRWTRNRSRVDECPRRRSKSRSRSSNSHKREKCLTEGWHCGAGAAAARCCGRGQVHDDGGLLCDGCD